MDGEGQDNILRRYGIYVIALVAMLPALVLRDLTPDNELRYVSIAGEALENGTFFAFTNHGVAYADKPPLYMWICMLGRRLFGVNCLWFVGLFSVIPAFVTTEVMARWSAPHMSRQWRTAARWMLLSSVLFLGLCLTMRMDMLMTMFIVLSLRVFYRMYSGDKSRRYRWLFPIYVFLGLFTKGPYGVLIPLLSTTVWLAINGRLKEWSRYWGWRTWLTLLGLCVVWFGAVFLEGGVSYLDNLVVKQTVGRAVKSFAHDEPFYYYLITIWYSIAPWSIAVVGVLVAALCSRKVRKAMPMLTRFFLVTAGVTFVVLSLVSAKLAVYMLPAFPFMVYGGALLLASGRYDTNVWVRTALLLPAVVMALTPIALPILSKKMPEAITPATIATLCVLSVLSIWSVVLLVRRSKADTLPKGIIAMAVAIYGALFAGGFAMPDFNEMIGYRELAAKAQRIAANEQTPIYTYKVRRAENLDVYLGREVTIIETADGETPAFPDTGLLLIRSKSLPAGTKVAATAGKYSIITLSKDFTINE